MTIKNIVRKIVVNNGVIPMVFMITWAALVFGTSLFFLME